MHYDKQANMVYQESADKLKNISRVLQFVRHHKNAQRPRLEMLDKYYKGIDHIADKDNKRRCEEDKADHRISHPFAKYIADFQTAYSVGNPITVQVDGGGQDDKLDEVNQANDVDTINYQLFLDATRFGRAYELVYRNQNDTESFVRLDPMETFVIYDLSVDPKPVMGVRYHILPSLDGETVTEKVVLETWTAKQHVTYAPSDIMQTPTVVLTEPSPIDAVQIVEYANNSFRMGDFETVIPLIDAYDAAESDTANYMTDFNDAMLVISGDIDTLLEGAEQTVDPMDKDAAIKLAKAKAEIAGEMKRANLLLLKNGINAQGQQTQTTAGYIYKQYDVSGTEAYKKRVSDDIHKFSHTPNLTDENFAVNASGVAMKYKLLGTVELAVIKRRSFEQGLYKRYTIVSYFEEAAHSGWKVDPHKLTFKFTDNLPEDDISQIQALVQAGATLPQLYLYKQLPDANPDELKKMLDEEREESPYNQLMGGDRDESQASQEAEQGPAETGQEKSQSNQQTAHKPSR